ncbi:hypothetical protein E2R51_13120 [Jeotgalibacillus sp. S-D1]|uniref:hypothetical protein n=1 Tax=Jeotgalibacillus sp. S-D1 TaxID=2552189 RepID=UPI00105AA54D|nr:hypothetical protein [Jeotgalibacillus sp. S-D1]TDL31309.1 hypothetical protein E2R51_13120 [Jeotgalibacillus sp. S-D1]
MHKRKSLQNDFEVNKSLAEAEKKVLIGIWIQTAATFLTAIGVTEELRILQAAARGVTNDFSAEKKAVAGVWLQFTGTLFSAIGFSQQLSPERSQQIAGRKTAIIGNSINAYGLTLEVIGESILLREELDEGILF